MKKLQKLSLRIKILVYFVFTTSILLLILGLTLFYSTSVIIKNEVKKTAKASIEKSGDQLEMYLEKLKGLSVLFTENPQISRYFDTDDQRDIHKNDKEDIIALISSILKTDPSLKSVIIVGSDGRLLTNEKTLDMDFTGKVMEQDWYKEAINSKMPVLTSAKMQEFSMDKDNWVISLGSEIRDQNNKHIGVLRIDLNYSAIEKVLSNLNLGNTGYAFILNEKEEVVYHKDTTYFMDQNKKNELVHVLKMQDKELSKENILTHSYQLKNTDWLLVGVSALDSVMMIQQDIILSLWIFEIIILFIAFGISALFSSSITRPIIQLEDIMKSIDYECMNTDFEIKGSVEITNLSFHFKSMIERIKTLLEEIKSKEKLIRSSELKVLYSQINPHFLYNTLDTIVWMAELGDTEKVVHISKAMASFFRLSLSGQNDMTTIKNELEHVRQYLYIQKERYQDKLAFEIFCDGSIEDLMIPKIILQPIVENSIFHGIRKLQTNGKISIKAYRENEYIIFTVQDNGVGFDTNKKNLPKGQAPLGGVGLKNVEERLCLYYGKGSGIDVSSKEGSGTLVKIHIKL